MKADVSKHDLVLVVDDSPETLSMLNDTLEQAGMTCLVALEAKQALSIAHKMLPDIIVLDAIMPNISGYTLCEMLKADRELAGIPVIFMTGVKEPDSVVKAFTAGGADYVTKPIVTAELIARMRVHLANSRIRLSAQSALDCAGQYVFAVDTQGHILWSTPQVKQIFDRYSPDFPWQQQLPCQIGQWMSHGPSNGMALKLDTPGGELKVVLLGSSAVNEYLLRLMDPTSPNEGALLQENLALTQREADVLLWISRGKTNREIAQILGISPRTINKHLEQIFKKLAVDNRTSAAAKALSVL